MIATQTFTQEATRILSYTKPIEKVSLLDFLRAYPDETRLYVENGRTSVAIAGVGSVTILTASGKTVLYLSDNKAQPYLNNCKPSATIRSTRNHN